LNAKSLQMARVVVDTNVLMIASSASSASLVCELSCLRAVTALMTRGKFVVDSNDLIIKEYRSVLSALPEGSFGSDLVIWLNDHLYGGRYIERIPITPVDGSGTNFSEFPGDAALGRFDPDDRKFIATALAHTGCRKIYQGLDTKWIPFNGALQRAGLQVEYLCPVDAASIVKTRTARRVRRSRKK
jgi:hypothetical protein